MLLERKITDSWSLWEPKALGQPACNWAGLRVSKEKAESAQTHTVSCKVLLRSIKKTLCFFSSSFLREPAVKNLNNLFQSKGLHSFLCSVTGSPVSPNSPRASGFFLLAVFFSSVFCALSSPGLQRNRRVMRMVSHKTVAEKKISFNVQEQAEAMKRKLCFSST